MFWHNVLDILSIIGAVLFMVFFFGFCIFIHELGHFLAARWRGLTVTAFSIGFRKIWSKKIGDVEYRIGYLPFGGYVEIPQLDSNCEENGEVKAEDGKVYPHAKPLDRIIAVFAGPLFNILFGFLLATVVWIVGIRQDTPKFSRIKVAEVEEESPEYRAGLRKGDEIVRLNGKKFHCTWGGFAQDILFTIDKVTLEVERAGKTFSISYLPVPNPKHQPDEEIAYPFFKPLIPVQVYPRRGGAAEKMGLKDNDRILAMDGIEIKNIRHFRYLLYAAQGRTVTLLVERDGKRLTFTGKSGDESIPPGESKAAGGWKLGFADNPVTEVLPGLPFDKAGIREGDRILSFNEVKVHTVGDAITFLENNKDREILVTVARGKKQETFTVKVRPVYLTEYDFGASFATKVHPTPWEQFTDVIDSTVRSMRSIGISLGRKMHLTKKHTTIQAKHMSGPIGIGRVLFLSVYLASFAHGLALVVMVTFSLGLLNLLPIPVLDGGHILLAFIELALRRPVPKKLLDPISFVFIGVLILFMLFVTFYDVKRIVNPLLKNFRSSPPAAEEQADKEKTPPGKPKNEAPAKETKEVKNGNRATSGAKPDKAD
ncbi:MAG: site-2 protease family protein [Lentisphaeria bacterium]|nr:site-2 protease family protein [Lentisphaeria bacterium]